MGKDRVRAYVCGQPGWVVAIWLVVATVIGCLAPNLTKLAAEGQAKMLASNAESRRAAELVRQSWPAQSYESMVVAILHRPAGLTDADKQYAGRRADRFAAKGH